MTQAGEPWYVAAFRDEYLTVYPHRDLDSARREAAWLIEHGVKGRVFDLCCGFGRHTLALREQGIDVVGLDLSPELLRHARELPRAELLDGRLLRGDARRLPFQAASFDSLVNLFSSFGYFGDAGDRQVLDEIARVLRPGGLAVLDLMNPARIRADLVPHSRTERAGHVLEEARSLEEGGSRVVKSVRLTLSDGHVRTWRESVRMYESAEMEQLLGARGLHVEAVHGGFAGEPAGARAPRQILKARKHSTAL